MAELCLFNEEFIFDNDMSTCDMFDISYKQGTGHSIKFTKIKFDQVFFNKRSNQRNFLESGTVKNGRCWAKTADFGSKRPISVPKRPMYHWLIL